MGYCVNLRALCLHREDVMVFDGWNHCWIEARLMVGVMVVE